MSVRVVGAGLGRTGTLSLKYALEQLLGGACYHMREVFAHPEHIESWGRAARGDMPEWRTLFRDYAAVVDWPAASFWPELSQAFPDALILLSVRDPQAWWTSANNTIFTAMGRIDNPAWRQMIHGVFDARFTLSLDDRQACIAAYERHVAEVRARIPADRLVQWQPGDGWAPLCAALDLPLPAAPFPHVNTTEEFLASHG